MKTLIKKLPLVGFILAIGAAFAFSSADLSMNETVYYRQADGEFLEKTGPGTCDLAQYNCEYEYIGSGTPVMDQDESSYQAIGQPNSVFVPASN